MKKPNKCPSCNSKIYITEFCCEKCSTLIKGKFNLGPFDCLDESEIEFVKIFLAGGGSIKEVEKALNISYPTVKSRLEEIVKKMGISDYDFDTKNKKMEILKKLERGEITAQDAVKMIKDLKK